MLWKAYDRKNTFSISSLKPKRSEVGEGDATMSEEHSIAEVHIFAEKT